MNSNDLPRSSPEAQGVDPAGISTFLDRLEPASDIEIHSLMIIRHGAVVAEGWWSPYAEERVHLLYSLSKSFTSTAAPFAIAEWCNKCQSGLPPVCRPGPDRKSKMCVLITTTRMLFRHRLCRGRTGRNL